MNHKLAFIAGALALFTFGCNQQHEQAGQADAAPPATANHEHSEDAQAEEGGSSTTTVTLDNGKRWKANPETTSGIANMVALIEKQAATPGDAKALKAALEEEFGLIFERCTMTGEAHNQLHNYLIPIHQRFSGFDAGDATQLADMKSYLGMYGNYFE
ncbi:MAG: hypothetical protein IPP83_10955 [Flavobacteriales bacterium]|nr:hypothetical protein [Flavobacteriales bacterium]